MALQPMSPRDTSVAITIGSSHERRAFVSPAAPPLRVRDGTGMMLCATQERIGVT